MCLLLDAGWNPQLRWSLTAFLSLRSSWTPDGELRNVMKIRLGFACSKKNLTALKILQLSFRHEDNEYHNSSTINHYNFQCFVCLKNYLTFPIKC